MESDRAEPFREFRLCNQRKEQVTVVGDVERAAYANLPSALSHPAFPLQLVRCKLVSTIRIPQRESSQILRRAVPP